MIKNYPEPNRIYKSSNGGLFKVLFLSINTETEEILVNYQSILFGTYFSTSLEFWNSTDNGVIRFLLVKN